MPGPVPRRWRRSRRVIAALSASLAVGTAACTGPEVDSAIDGDAAGAATAASGADAAIAEFNRQYLQAINEGDIDALAALTTDNHLMISSGGEPLAGREALVEAMTRAFAAFEFDESWTPEETVISGDLGYQRGTFVVVASPRDGGARSQVNGNFLRIYRRQPDGRWLMVRDMHNSAPARQVPPTVP